MSVEMDDVERLVEEWRVVNEQRHAAVDKAEANRLFMRLQSLHLRIFRRADRGIDAFAKLLRDPHSAIRIDAAAALLPHRPEIAKPILLAATDRSLTARYVLAEWGRKTMPPTDDAEEDAESARERITKLYAAIDERFDFVYALGFRRTVVEKRVGSRAAQARYECGDRYLDIWYDTYDGSLDVYVGGGEFDQRLSLWEIMTVRGDWDYIGYTGHTVHAMRAGVERAARYLDAHRDILIADATPTELAEIRRRRSQLTARYTATEALPTEPDPTP